MRPPRAETVSRAGSAARFGARAFEDGEEDKEWDDLEAKMDNLLEHGTLDNSQPKRDKSRARNMKGNASQAKIYNNQMKVPAQKNNFMRTGGGFKPSSRGGSATPSQGSANQQQR